MVYLLCMSTRIATRQIQLPNRIKLNLVNGDRSAAINTLKLVRSFAHSGRSACTKQERCENQNTRRWLTLLVVPKYIVNGQFQFNLSTKTQSCVFGTQYRAYSLARGNFPWTIGKARHSSLLYNLHCHNRTQQSRSRENRVYQTLSTSTMSNSTLSLRPPVSAAIKDPTRSASSVAFNIFGSGGSTLHQISEQVRCYISTAQKYHALLRQYNKLSCRRETARRFLSLNILLSHSRSLEVIRSDTVAQVVYESLLVFQ